MMSLSMIRQIQAEAASAARRQRKQPKMITAIDIRRAEAGDLSGIAGMPFLGNYVPKGWARVNLDKAFALNEAHHGVESEYDQHGAFFVDKTGWGDPGEPALTIKEFVHYLRDGYGYAIIEEGQFQIYVAVYRPIVRAV